jgi:hypothetical protein
MDNAKVGETRIFSSYQSASEDFEIAIGIFLQKKEGLTFFQIEKLKN